MMKGVKILGLERWPIMEKVIKLVKISFLFTLFISCARHKVQTYQNHHLSKMEKEYVQVFAQDTFGLNKKRDKVMYLVEDLLNQCFVILYAAIVP